MTPTQQTKRPAPRQYDDAPVSVMDPAPDTGATSGRYGSFYLGCLYFSAGSWFAALGWLTDTPDLMITSAGIALGGLSFVVWTCLFGSND